MVDAQAVPEDVKHATDDAISVLHVDDDGPLLDLAATFLERENGTLDVHTETDVEAAVDRVAEDDAIDCVVSDYRMPGTNGIEFLKAVRERRPDVPFILFTGEGSEAVAERAFSAGATDYYRKEATTDQYAVLAKRIECVVQRTRNRRRVDRLRMAIETTREGVAILDDAGRFRYVNRAYAALVGYDRTDLVGHHWTVLYGDRAAERIRESALPAARSNGTWRGEPTQLRADGTEVDTDLILTIDDDGSQIWNVRRASTTTNDARPHAATTAEARTASTSPDDSRTPSTPVATRDSTHATDVEVPPAALDALEDLLFVIDPDGTLQSWNDRVPAVTGLSAAELAATTPADLVVDEDAARMDRYVHETRADGETHVEADVVTADGEPVTHEFISKPVSDDGETLTRIGLARDVSTRKEYEGRIERQNERLDRFAGIVSHDLRNPLFVAREQFRFYQQTGDHEDYERGQRALARIESLITDVLTLAQHGDAIHLEAYDDVDLAAVAEDAWSLIELEDTTLTVEATASVRADESRMRQLLENLFRNGIEHGGTDVSIRVGPLDDAGFYVADDGPGIPAADREVVFESGHSTKADGTGFGLATVALLTDAHGWTVEIAESDEGGARFEFTGVETEPGGD